MPNSSTTENQMTSISSAPLKFGKPRVSPIYGEGYVEVDVILDGEKVGEVHSYPTETSRQMASGIRYSVRQVKRWGARHVPVEGVRYGVLNPVFGHTSRKGAAESLVRLRRALAS